MAPFLTALAGPHAAFAILSLSLCLCIGMIFDSLRSVHLHQSEHRYIRDSNRRLNATEGKRRENCQIVYITGVEGSSHHGVLPIIEALAKQQIDPETGLGYHVDMDPRALKSGLYGWYNWAFMKSKWHLGKDPGIHDTALAKRVVSSMCPNDGRKHVMVEWASFPSGLANDKREYRVRRQKDWLKMTPEEIANDELALAHPVDMNAFYDAYSPHAEIKFIVLNRDYTETIASHRFWDGGPEGHSKVISGFMIILSRFLNSHLNDSVTGSKLWTMLCLDSIVAKNYQNVAEATEARRHVIQDMATFLGWPVKDCPDCFNNWQQSIKVPTRVLGPSNMNMLVDHMSALEGVWPPKRSDDMLPEQQCELISKSTVQALELMNSSPTPVIIYIFGTRGKRSQSIFHTGHLQRYGTGRVNYVLRQRDDCSLNEISPHDTTPCLAVNHFANPKCTFEGMTKHYSTCKTILTNDENCRDKRYDARGGYYSSAISDKAYLPLGPRYDSWNAFIDLMNQGSMRLPPSMRKYAFNAIFSKSTSAGRATLEEVIQKEGSNGLASFVQISPKWRENPNSASNSLADTTTYMQALLDSTFTLSPAGHNPECFRLYEAVEAGSIPVIALDNDYKHHACKDSLSHWLDSPIVIVESWNEIIPTLQRMLDNPAELDKRQEDLRAWYNQHMRTVVQNFETFLLSSQKRPPSIYTSLVGS